MRRRLILLLGLAMAISLTLAPAVTAHGGHHHKNYPSKIALPDGFQPEGVTSAWGHRLYAGSLVDGAIWKGSAKTGKGSIFIEGTPGQQALGIHVDWRGRLWVAGGGDQTIRVYNARNGDLLQTYEFPTAGFINDLVVTHWGVYGTDSTDSQMLVVPFRPWGKLPTPDKAKVVDITGDLLTIPGAFNSNGIVARGKWLLIVSTEQALVFRVNPRTGESQMVEMHGFSASFGDGLLLRGRFLYIVHNQENKVSVVKLNRSLTEGRFKGTITKSTLDIPTTGTFAAGRLYVVNARFGVADPSTAEYWISKLPVWPNT
jgi:hypothetical protein